ncbi:type II secretion system protein [Candidatus Woesebacteria bacterium]|nr:type II secretion system protein [Candidatus Woesebacteria bacterium]
MMKKSGFTLIELLVVISLLGILATLLIANLSSARQRGRDVQRKSDLRNIATAMRLYYNDYGVYPASSVGGEILGCGAGGTGTCAWGTAWDADNVNYMSTLPADPLSTQSYSYQQVSLDSFRLLTCLENASDEDGKPEVGIDCTSDTMYEFVQQ